VLGNTKSNRYRKTHQRVGRNSDSVLRRMAVIKHSADYAIANPPYDYLYSKVKLCQYIKSVFKNVVLNSRKFRARFKKSRGYFSL
jgi:hypothetical protein